GELGLSVALHTGDGENLARPHIETDVLDDDMTELVDNGKISDDERGITGLRLALVDRQLDRATDHERGELDVARGGRRLTHDLAEPDDGNTIGDLANLAQLVRDEHDRRAALFELAHDRH